MLLHWGDEYLRKLIPERLHGRLNEATVDANYEFKPTNDSGSSTPILVEL
jgi:hypothetical protein